MGLLSVWVTPVVRVCVSQVYELYMGIMTLGISVCRLQGVAI